MAMGSQQLADDYGQLKELLELYPNITLTKTDGQPPDNYEIEYKIRGYIKESDQGVTIGRSHRIRISLPFGYPHFAPIAKPLSPIFHPDFDPAAIRIADRWQENPSLPDLVLHIGEMICGSSYSLEDPFNPEAAEWYREHASQLPLDQLNLADIEEGEADGLDSLVNDTFASLGLENDDFLEPERPFDPAELDRIRDLVRQNQVYTAQRMLAQVPETVDFADREELQQTIGKALRKTDQLFKLAEQLEEMGKFAEALEVVHNLLEVAADAPGIDGLRARIEQSFLAAQSVERPPAPEKEPELRPGNAAQPPPPARATVAKRPLPSLKGMFRGTAIPFKGIVVGILVLGCCIGGISLYFRDQNTISLSQASVLKAQLQMDKKQFDGALETLETAKKILDDLTILRLRKGRLAGEIDALITSKDLQEGLQGRVLYQGEYIPARTAKAIAELGVLTDQAQAMAGQNQIQEALTLYKRALKFAEDNKLGKQQASLSEVIQSLELRRALSMAEQAEQSKNWDQAAEAYRKALDLSSGIKSLGTASDITHRLTAATFRHELDQSKKAFTQSQWKETIKYLEQAQEVINANPNVVNEKERQDLHRLLVNARLYLMLSTAREAYQQKNWDQAITEYQNALNLLASEPGSTENMLDDSLGKIEKTLLLVKIAQIQENVLIAEGKNDLNESLARNREIQRLVRTSKYADDPSLVGVLQKVNEKIDKQLETISQNEKIAWLEEHFEEIFRANYPTFKGSKLLQPKAVFLRKVDAKSIFTLTCVERSQGSSSKLELNYMFDASTGKWSVYNGE